MEELNKNQLILLALLVSFITSIATGIVTVTLMDQAPPTVTQTVNRVVQHTVERVVPGEGNTETVVKEVPIIVTEEELIVKAVAKASPVVSQIVRVSVSGESNPRSAGSAVLIDKDKGLFITSASNVKPEDNTNFQIATVDGENLSVRVIMPSETSRIAVLEIRAESKNDFDSLVSGKELLPLAKSEIAIGQTVVGVGSTSGVNHTVAVGIVSSISGEAGARIIKSGAATDDLSGGAMLNIQGELIGMILSQAEAVTANQIKAVIDSLK